MAVHRIVKAPTYGKKGEWQTCDEFRRKAIDVASENNLDEWLCEEALDDVVMVLEIMGHVILSEG